MKAVIFNDQNLTNQINNLIQYTKKFSGVDIEVIDWKKVPTYLDAIGQYNEKFRYTANLLKEDFVWLEYDSIPIDEDWMEELKEAWDSIKGSPIQGMMSPDFQSPFSMSCPVGIYKASIRGLIPRGFMQCTFDSWIANNQQDSIERTALIQHSAGYYNNKGSLTEHKFPDDYWMLRESAVIFCSDKSQSIINDYYNPEQEERLTL
jgi:hypothetical protein